MLIAFNKPFGVLSQFTPDESPNHTLAEFGFPKNVYPIGRLDADSEGLLLLSDESDLNQRLLHPRHAHQREYWAQVERVPTAESLHEIQAGIILSGQRSRSPSSGRRHKSPSPPLEERAGERRHSTREQTTLPCAAWILEPQPKMPDRSPPIRFRKTVPTCWIALELIEGKNRQVRRMTAAIGHPTLRLVRVRIGKYELGKLAPGKWIELDSAQRRQVLA